jgi:uncharacterized membrane protein SpoIIM required for sporulation
MPLWRELEHHVLGERALWSLPASSISRMASLYRSACADLMRARRLGCTPDTIAFLDGLVARAHHALYSSAGKSSRSLAELLLVDFPRSVRKNGWLVLAATGLFWIPFAVGLLGALGSEEFAQNVLSAQQLQQLSEAYADGFDGRSGGTDAAMAGFYVYNNVGIALRCFATGVLFGLGSVFFMIYNGLAIGAVFGYIHRVGHGENLLTFVCGHGPFELTAIVLAGAAGLRLGQSLIDTGGLTRIGSLRRSARELVAMVLGIAAMLLIAAGIEAFWSPSSIPRTVKYAFSAFGMVSVLAFLTLAGRVRPERAQ